MVEPGSEPGVPLHNADGCPPRLTGIVRDVRCGIGRRYQARFVIRGEWTLIALLLDWSEVRRRSKQYEGRAGGHSRPGRDVRGGIDWSEVRGGWQRTCRPRHQPRRSGGQTGAEAPRSAGTYRGQLRPSDHIAAGCGPGGLARRREGSHLMVCLDLGDPVFGGLTVPAALLHNETCLIPGRRDPNPHCDSLSKM